MAAFIPSRRDEELNAKATAKVREDKQRESGDGFDGTWVAHPDLVEVALAEFDAPNQLERQRPEVEVSAAELLDVASTPGEVTEDGLRNDVSVGIQYLSSWLRGTGAAAIYNLMEDAATAEIARSQVWQWIRHGRFERDRVRDVIGEELRSLRETFGDEIYDKSRADDARAIFEQVALGDEFIEFLTLPAYDYLED
jgi:malate synthase